MPTDKDIAKDLQERGKGSTREYEKNGPQVKAGVVAGDSTAINHPGEDDHPHAPMKPRQWQEGEQGVKDGEIVVAGGPADGTDRVQLKGFVRDGRQYSFAGSQKVLLDRSRFGNQAEVGRVITWLNGNVDVKEDKGDDIEGPDRLVW